MGKYKRKEKHFINNQIRAKEVRVVGNGENTIMPKEEAIKKAKEQNLDLVEINRNSSPSVCKIIDYKKFIFEQKKKKKEIEKKSVKQELKEIRFSSPNIEQNDIDYRLDQAKKFLKKKNKVKFTVQFKGRQMAYKDVGKKLLLEVSDSLEDWGVAESMPKMHGRRMEITLKPVK